MGLEHNAGLPREISSYYGDEEQSSYIKLMTMLCKQEYSATAAVLSQNAQVQQGIKQQFNILLAKTFLDDNFDDLVQILKGLSAHNGALGDWLIKQLLEQAEEQKLQQDQQRSVQLITQLVQCTTVNVYERLEKLHAFV